MASIAAAPEPAELRKYTGLQRAAAVMLALGKDGGAEVWKQLTLPEVKELSAAVASLGRVPAQVVEHLLGRFGEEIGSAATLHGSYESTEQLLDGVLPPDALQEVMEDIRGPSGRTMWDKLSNVSESVLAAYLRNEYPQTVAVILGRLEPEHAARVIGELPPELSADVVLRMLRTDAVGKEVLQEVEATLKAEFMNNQSRTKKRDPHESMAELFNALDRGTEERLLTALDAQAPDAAGRIRALMFTFDDLANLLPAAIATLVREADKREVALALKAAGEPMRDLFFGTMTERAAKMLKDEMAAMGPVRARDCEDAQASLVRLAKTLADDGQIVLADPKGDDQMIP